MTMNLREALRSLTKVIEASRSSGKFIDVFEFSADKCLAVLRAALEPQPVNLFKAGPTTLHSGQQSNFKIDCDALTDADIDALAGQLREILPSFGSVEGVPSGGLRIAAAMQKFAEAGNSRLVIVDDVLTTGSSMEVHRAGRDAYGAVLFVRGIKPKWVASLFTMAQQDVQPVPMVTRSTGRTIPDLTKREHVCEWQGAVEFKQPVTAGECGAKVHRICPDVGHPLHGDWCYVIDNLACRYPAALKRIEELTAVIEAERQSQGEAITAQIQANCELLSQVRDKEERIEALEAALVSIYEQLGEMQGEDCSHKPGRHTNMCILVDALITDIKQYLATPSKETK